VAPGGAAGAPVPPTAAATDDDGALPREIQKLAFEVAVRINRVTPVTPTSLVTMAMLGTGARALTLEEITATVASFVRFVEDRSLPTTEGVHLDTAAAVRSVLEALIRHKVVTAFTEGPEPVYQIAPDQQIAAAYYRNTIAHFFLTPAIAELALLEASEARSPGDPRPAITVFWDEVMELRDLLKHDFFFPDKDAHRREVADELARQDAAWERRIAEGSAAIQHLVAGFHPFTAHRVPRPFVDAYLVVADLLVGAGDRVIGDDRQLVGDALTLAKQYALRGLVSSNESASRVLLETGLRLAQGRRLDEAGPALAANRRAFARELADVARRVRSIEALSASRRAGLIE
jgi:glycerol-3-phosphate O-acyltransferase